MDGEPTRYLSFDWPARVRIQSVVHLPEVPDEDRTQGCAARGDGMNRRTEMDDTMKTATQEYVLPVAPDYVPNWGFWAGCRELLQNSIDQCVSDWQSSMVFDYDVMSHTLRIGATNCGLHPKTLLLGHSTKRGNDRMLGQHGEGYKLALLVLARLLMPVKVINRDQIWTPEFRHSQQYDEHVLTIFVSDNPRPINGVEFVIGDVNQEKYAEVCANYLPDEPGDRILEADYLRGRIFVGGLFVTEYDHLRYGYNFMAGRLRLDRDRQMLDTYDVAHATSCLWGKVGDTNRIMDELSRGSADLDHVSAYLPSDKCEQVSRMYAAKNPGVVPITNENDKAMYPGAKTQIVPRQFRDVLHKTFQFFAAPTASKTPAERLRAHGQRWSWSWNGDQRKAFSDIESAAGNWLER